MTVREEIDEARERLYKAREEKDNLISEVTTSAEELERLQRLAPISPEDVSLAEAQARLVQGLRDLLEAIRLEDTARSDVVRLEPLLAVRKAVDETAILMCHLSPGQWTGWLVYLLKALDTCQPGEASVLSALECVRDRIATRLKTGSW